MAEQRTGRDSTPPEVQLFVHEDISKPENRINLALLSVLMVPAFRHWFLGRLGLTPDCTVYPPRNIGELRPDFVAVSQAGTVKAWIEIELAGENAAQLDAYRNRLSAPIKSIVRPRDAASDVSLEELAEIASTCLNEIIDRQQRKSVQIFVDLVGELGGRASTWDYRVPVDAIKRERFPNHLSLLLGSLLTFGKPPLVPGQAQITTITQQGWSLRVYARNSTYASVSILWKQALKGQTLRVPSSEQLAKYLRLDAAQAYRDFFQGRFGLDIDQLAGLQSLPVDENELLDHLHEYASRVRHFLAVEPAP